MKVALFICVLSIVALTLFVEHTVGERKNWVLLIAGSNTYTNYRHQADICHAYQIVHANGIPDEQIIVMMYDDIANNSMNPYPGNIINQPDGPNVYTGVPKDYTKHDVNSDVFLKVLQGDQDGVRQLTGRNGKVIDSGPEDYIFVNFADHGGPGELGMPAEPYLKARDLNDALQNMYDQKRFAKLTFYVEACDSGSMFEGLLSPDINVYVTTAANAHESSYGCYCENDRHTCLGDTYSVMWMQNCDAYNIHEETLEDQYNIVRDETTESHVMQYGDLSFTSLTVDEFVGKGGNQSKASHPQKFDTPHRSVVPSDEVGIHTLTQLLASPTGQKNREEIIHLLEDQLMLRSETQKILMEVAQGAYPGQHVQWAVEKRPAIQEWDCYEHAVDHLFDRCTRLRPSQNDFVLRRLNTMVNLCNDLSERVVIAAVDRAADRSPLCY